MMLKERCLKDIMTTEDCPDVVGIGINGALHCLEL